MVPTVASNVIINIGLLLIIGVHLVSSGQNSGILARLYKKAAQQERPLILVLDNSQNKKSKNVPKAHKHNVANIESNKDLAPLVYLYQLGQSQKKKQIAKDNQDDYIFNSKNHIQDIKERQQEERFRVEDLDRKESDYEGVSSPLLKKLLAISNNLLRQKEDTCGGSDNECAVSKESESAGCGDDTLKSTKGVLYSAEKSQPCKKCF